MASSKETDEDVLVPTSVIQLSASLPRVVICNLRPTAEFIISCINGPDELLAALAPEKK